MLRSSGEKHLEHQRQALFCYTVTERAEMLIINQV